MGGRGSCVLGVSGCRVFLVGLGFFICGFGWFGVLGFGVGLFLVFLDVSVFLCARLRVLENLFFFIPKPKP